jgi:hypothetical protein
LITEEELQEAIAECHGQRNPNSNTCIKLASFYTILDHVTHRQEETPMYSFANIAENTQTIEYNGSTEFADAVNGKDINSVMAVMDELMTTIMVVNPPLYRSVMRRVTK